MKISLQIILADARSPGRGLPPQPFDRHISGELPSPDNIIQESESQYGDSARAVQSNYRGAGAAQGPRPRPPLQAWGSRSRQQGPPLRGAPRGFPLPGGTLTPSGPLSSASIARPFPGGRDPRGTQPLPKKGRAPGSLEGCLQVGGATLVFSWRLCGLRLSAYGPRATISLPKHERAAPPSQAPVWRPVLPLGTWDSCEAQGSLRQRAGRRGPALSPVRAPLVSSRGACATWGGGAGWGDGGQKPAGGGQGTPQSPPW